MPFTLLYLEKNGTCDGMNFTHLNWLMLLHYPVKIETPKMHVKWAEIQLLTLTMKQPSNAPNYIDSFIKCSDEPHNTNEQ